jgi:signal transduction histidine kinase
MNFSPGDESFLVQRLTRAAVIGGLIAGGVALLLALYLSSRLSHPVRLLTAAAQRLSSGDLSQRVAIQGEDELAELGQTFNRMAGSLQTAQESRRAMTADIAHELRNPLAVQRAHLEALQDGIYPLTGENLGPVLAQNVLLTRLVEDLRMLAQADAGQLELNFSQVDLSDLTARVVARYRPQADALKVAIAFETVSDCPAVPADPERIEQVLGNLLSNALRFVPEGGKINLTLTCEPKEMSLTVRDDGPGIPTEALPRLFERFYRADRGRSRQDGGSGLGLAIARQIVELHGGSISVENHPQGGAVFQINLPRERVDGQK